MNILIAEDDLVSAAILRKMLKSLGHTVTTVENGVQAWAQLQTASFSLVVSDWMMPEMDGLELCRKIRARENADYVYIILLTARSQQEDRLAGLQAGADDFLAKPVDREEIIARLDVGRRILTMQWELADAFSTLKSANRRFEELFLGVPVACIVLDNEGRIKEWNRASEQLFGARAEQVLEKKLWETGYRMEGMEESGELLRYVLKGNAVEQQDCVYAHPDGSQRHLVCNLFPLRGPDGSVIGVISASTDITAHKELENRLEEQLLYSVRLNVALDQQRHELTRVNEQLGRMVITDSLTGIRNRRHFYETLEAQFRTACDLELPISIIMADVDDFKQYNDTYGHLAGDEVLKAVAQVLEKTVGEAALVARYGGEEFVVLLPMIEAEIGLQVAEQYATPSRIMPGLSVPSRQVSVSRPQRRLPPVRGSCWKRRIRRSITRSARDATV